MIVCSCSGLMRTSEEISGFLHKHSMPPFNCRCRVWRNAAPLKKQNSDINSLHPVPLGIQFPSGLAGVLLITA